MNIKTLLVCGCLLSLSGCKTMANWYLPEEAINSETSSDLGPFVQNKKIDISKIQFEDRTIPLGAPEDIVVAQANLKRAEDHFDEAHREWELSKKEVLMVEGELKALLESKTDDALKLNIAREKLSMATAKEEKLRYAKIQAETNIVLATANANNNYIFISKTSASDAFKAGIYLSNKSCELHKAEIRGYMDAWNIGAGVTSLALAGAAAIVDHSGTASDLAAAAAFVTGSQGIVNSELYSDALDGIVISTIDNARQKKLADLQAQGPYTDIYDAINAVEAYHSVCSLNYALTQIQDAVSDKFRQKSKRDLDSDINYYENSIDEAYKKIKDIQDKIPGANETNNVQIQALLSRATTYEKRMAELVAERELANY